MPLRIRFILALLVVTFVHIASRSTVGQATAWQPLTISDGVEISFIVHPYGDGSNTGVVIKLVNFNEREVLYRFRVIFRSGPRQWISEPVEGALYSLEVKTGELSGLWWIPFKDGAPVTEVGLRGLRIRMASPDREQDGARETS